MARTAERWVRVVLAGCALWVASPALAAQTAEPAPERFCGGPGPRPVGRYELGERGELRVAYSGAGVVVRFRGSSLEVALRETPHGAGMRGHYAVSIDGGPAGTLVADPSQLRYVLAEGLPPGEHVVELRRRTEPLVSTGELLAFHVPGGELLPPPCEAERKLLVVGDSITAAFGVLGPGPDCPFTPELEDHLQSYAHLAAQALGAESHVVAWSGKGVLRNMDGSAELTLPSLFDAAVPTRPGSGWDHLRYHPDAVVILAGSNDFKTGIPEERAFIGAYLGLIRRAREVHPGAEVVVSISPLLSDGYPRFAQHRTTARRYLQQVVREAGPGVSFLELEEQRKDDGLGCSGHPSPTTHRKMAARLVAHLRARLGW